MARDRDAQRSAAKKLVADRRAVQDAANTEAMERMDAAQPTPTQEECDLAKLGVAVDDKEDHGGEDETEVLQRMMASRVGTAAPYETRVLAEGEEPAPKQRKRGRPRK